MLLLGPPPEAGGGAEALHLVVGDLFRPGAKPASDEAPTEVDVPADEPPPEPPAVGHLIGHGPSNGHARTPVAPDAADGDVPIADGQQRARVVVPDTLPLALGSPPPPSSPRDSGDSPYLTGRAHLDAMLDLVAARVALAIADAWNSRPAVVARRDPPPARARGRGAGRHLGRRLRAREARRDDHAGRGAPARGVGPRRTPAPRAASACPSPSSPARSACRRSPRRCSCWSPRPRSAARSRASTACSPTIRTARSSIASWSSRSSARQSSLRDQIARELAPDAPLVRHGVVQRRLEPGVVAVRAADRARLAARSPARAAGRAHRRRRERARRRPRARRAPRLRRDQARPRARARRAAARARSAAPGAARPPRQRPSLAGVRARRAGPARDHRDRHRAHAAHAARAGRRAARQRCSAPACTAWSRCCRASS